MATLDRKNPDAAIPQLEKRIEEVYNTIVKRAYPVGSLFHTSDSNFDPNKEWGGKWEKTASNPHTWNRIR